MTTQYTLASAQAVKLSADIAIEGAKLAHVAPGFEMVFEGEQEGNTVTVTFGHEVSKADFDRLFPPLTKLAVTVPG